MKPKVRNPYGIVVHKRLAGRHGKTTKATRRKEKMETQMRGRSFNGEAFGFYPNELGSLPGAPTII